MSDPAPHNMWQLILNNKIYGHVDDFVFIADTSQIVFTTINNLRGICLPVQAVNSLRLNDVTRLEFHHKYSHAGVEKYIVYRASPSHFKHGNGCIELNGLKHYFVPLKLMERLVMRDESSRQRTLSEVNA